MLVNFTFKNWMSYKNETVFTMVGTNERQHSHRIPKVPKFGQSFKILPFCSIYGGNASGKSNLIEALAFVKQFVVNQLTLNSVTHTKPYKLDKSSRSSPTSFKIEMLINEVIYEYSFSLNYRKVMSEKLVEINSTSEKTLFKRIFDDEHNKYIYTYHDKINKDDQVGNRIAVIADGTAENRLFLTNTINQQIDIFANVYDWFNNKLEIVTPTAKFELFEHFFDEGSKLHIEMNKILAMLDTGITKLGFDRININSTENDKFKQTLSTLLSRHKSVKFTDETQRYVAKLDANGEIVLDKLVTYHEDDSGKSLKFDVNDESDGTRRLIDLLPIMLDAIQETSNKVYIVDEIERSLNTILTKALIDLYFEKCNNKSRSQLIVSTHDLLLMDQKFMRRDEMWVTERGIDGSSCLYSFSDFKDVRNDKDIRKSYLQGKMGGIPKILIDHSLQILNREEPSAK
ncbi:AAA family ATPase [Fangia hongkongensis]|uniref:AAA family ATPase n=1 Tax=Fangia hongkongensis TaxID=270495 RepID=UPI000375263B|nr:ATP-binding protein [Fangia hongkongensis]